MERKIIGFHKDERDDWVAELDCHHNQHVRHKPPFEERPWVQTGQGREERLGTVLECVLCDRLEFPKGLSSYRRTPEFTETSVPAGLLRDHSTRAGVWGLIHVLEGRLLYTVSGRDTDLVLEAGDHGVVAPERLHHVTPIGEVRFFVEFYRKSD